MTAMTRLRLRCGRRGAEGRPGRPGGFLIFLLPYLSGVATLGLGGCKDLTGSQPLPAGTVNPSSYNTPNGVVGMRNQALYDLKQALVGHIVATGLLTDELQSKDIGASAGVLLTGVLSSRDALDARLLLVESYGSSGNDLVDNDYGALQHVRADISQALGAIAAYDTGAKAVGDPRVLRAELFALQGYTEILLADFYCSGVPLSTFDFQRDYTYHASSRTDQVYQDAIANEDSALALAGTNDTILNLARVLKGRALLNGGDVAAAAQVVALVPDGFKYQLALDFRGTLNNDGGRGDNQLNVYATVADTEGRNGLPYLSSGDPRTRDTVTQVRAPFQGFFVPQTFPRKYSLTGFSPFVVASGVEARLIQAEAALKMGNAAGWLTTLNQLRTTGTYSGVTPPDTIPADTIIDTLGVTGCTRNANTQPTCGGGPLSTGRSNDPLQGQPSGFPPTGYSLVAADTTYPAPDGIQDYCFANSYYLPCSGTTDPTNPHLFAGGDSMVVFVYVRPQRIIPGDTLWNAGTGGVNQLGPLRDPGAALSGSAADSARVALLFRERAFWFFLTGERQGDLRRLLRQYRAQGFQRQDQVYPTGLYTAPGTSVYGTDVTAPIPGTEYLNPLFHGCLDRNP